MERRLARYLNVVDWTFNPDVQRKMRRDVKRRLRPTGEYSEDDLGRLARSIVDMTRRRGQEVTGRCRDNGALRRSDIHLISNHIMSNHAELA